MMYNQNIETTAVLRMLLFSTLLYDLAAAQSAAVPRWGQAAELVENMLYVQGGRTDQYNSYSYSSAPISNDLLLLPLSSPFNVNSPPWDVVGGCTNCSAPQGPAVCWHSLSAFNSSNLLLFGGATGPNSPPPLPEEPDSSVILDAGNVSDPQWDFETPSWAQEPLRRMYHSASAAGGKVWIVGGQKTDGSGEGFSDHYVFDPSIPSFSQLPSTNGPPDIYGHSSVVLSNGWLLVFGGFSQTENSLIPLTTVWAMDTTQSNLGWATLSVSDVSLPSPRRGFASTLIDGNKVLIHGGSDAELQSTLSDGWILDTTQTPMQWASIDALSPLGPRRDHIAVTVGSQVLFGFGYGTNGPADPSLRIFDVSNDAFVSEFTPVGSGTDPAPGSSAPGTSATQASTAGQGSGEGGPSQTSPGLGQSAPAGTNTNPGSSPTITSSGGGNPGSSGSGGGGSGNGSGNNGGNGSSDDSSTSDSRHVTAIALGTVFGVLGLLAGTSAAAYYLRRQSRLNSFHLLGPSDEDGHAGLVTLPVATASQDKNLPITQTLRGKFGALASKRATPQTHRRDMLADEDTHDFDNLLYWRNGVRRQASSAQSSWNSTVSRKLPSLSEMMHESIASLRTAGDALVAYAAGARGTKSREASAGSRSTAWWEKDSSSFEPYTDDVGLIPSAAPSSRASRPKGGRQSSSLSGYSVVDPFADYESDDSKPPGDYVFDVDVDMSAEDLTDPPPRSYVYSRGHGPSATFDLTRLSTLTEQPSMATLSDPTASSDSTSRSPYSPAGTHPDTSRSSHEIPRSPLPRPSSIIDANPAPSQPIRRSDSWWTRFAKTPLLDRRSSERRPLDFRDPQPPPRLNPIEEATHSRPQSRRARMYSSATHGRSASSLQTAKTANSETVERVGRTMDIVQRGTVSSHSSAPSVDSAVDVDHSPEHEHEHAPPGRPLSVVLASSQESVHAGGPEMHLVQSPTEMTVAEHAAPRAVRRTSPASVSPPPRAMSSGQVAAHVQAYERRMSMSQQDEAARLPPAAHSKRERGSVYGVVPKPSLFVANPDHSHRGPSGSS